MCATLGRMSDRKLRRVNAPSPPVALSAYELVTLRRQTQTFIRKAEKRIKRAAELGLVPPGADANRSRLERLRELDEKLAAWMDATWPAIVEMRRALREDVCEHTGRMDCDCPECEDDAATATREAWLAESRLEGERLAQADA